MALREFTDDRGERWRVWDTVPVRLEGMGEFRSGWLTFDNGTERRRLAPVPPGWAELPPSRLELLLRVAHATTHRDTRVESGEPERRHADRRHADRRHGDRRVQDRRKPES